MREACCSQVGPVQCTVMAIAKTTPFFRFPHVLFCCLFLRINVVRVSTWRLASSVNHVISLSTCLRIIAGEALASGQRRCWKSSLGSGEPQHFRAAEGPILDRCAPDPMVRWIRLCYARWLEHVCRKFVVAERYPQQPTDTDNQVSTFPTRLCMGFNSVLPFVIIDWELVHKPARRFTLSVVICFQLKRKNVTDAKLFAVLRFFSGFEPFRFLLTIAARN